MGPPAALLTRGTMRFRFVALLFSEITNRSPSEIKDVRVRPSAAALRFACLRRSAGSRTVVRSTICLDICMSRPYVNHASPFVNASSAGYGRGLSAARIAAPRGCSIASSAASAASPRSAPERAGRPSMTTLSSSAIDEMESMTSSLAAARSNCLSFKRCGRICTNNPLFHDRVRKREQRGRNGQAERSRGLEIREQKSHGNSATCSRPIVSGKPSIRFMFCTA